MNYGGLQVGVALIYFFLARDPSYDRLGAFFSLLFYSPIALYRLTTLAIFRPTSPVTWGTAALELGLLVWGVVVWRTARVG